MMLTACASALAGSGHRHDPPKQTPKPAYDVTSKVEAQRVDRVPAPEPNWAPCYEEWGTYECATFPVPLDYDKPSGPQVQLALLKHPASKPEQKIGSLFVNPGGPGAGAQGLALEMPFWFGASVIDRFDVIGMDPRGVGGSTPIRCFNTFQERNAAWEGHLNPVNLPATAAEEEAEVASARAVGKGCSSYAQPLVSSMSTAEVARDMDVLRRAVGDKKLTYWGVSYGTYLGEVYANMFPDRVRAMNLDGNIEPRAWVGNPLTKYQPMFDRLRSADGSYKALAEILRRCAAVGQPTCKFAGGDPLAKFGKLAKRLRTETVTVKVGGYGEVPPRTLKMGYNWFVQQTRTLLAYPTGWESIDAMLASLWTLTGEGAASPSPAAKSSARRALGRSLTQTYRLRTPGALGAGPAAVAALTPKEEAQEATLSFEESLRAVMCSDGLHAPDASIWRLTGALADQRAPYFGRVWNYIDTPCATNTWTAHDEDAYFGPFDRRTANPVLITANYWDPNTNYDSGVAVWKLMPNSRLISADSWGHAAYWTAPCVENTVNQYLITAVPPAAVTKCKGTVQPFETAASSSRSAGSGYVPALPGNTPPWR
ncbi:MAG TPA: alpha/beta fold hydrolase [Solirubrobacterales bacterium]|jgi:pimeloyl-ACP methyl ester carboxylesterase|nr:alpha/beta fold hydrolase [Solirubrobacterales bacterium]